MRILYCLMFWQRGVSSGVTFEMALKRLLNPSGEFKGLKRVQLDSSHIKSVLLRESIFPGGFPLTKDLE